MRIDNSRMKAFWNCPSFYQERYINDLEPQGRTQFAFGTRWHQLLEERYRRQKGEDFTAPPCDNEDVENEARTMLARYEAHYPEEPFDVIAVEQFFELALPCPECGLVEDHKMSCDTRPTHHTYCGEMDAIVRDKATGLLQLFETKSERRGSKANLPDAWAARSQVGLYLWAAEQTLQRAVQEYLA
jgi:hypothetical protein